MTYSEQLIIDYKNKSIVVDTNLWLLLLVGAYDRKAIANFKRTQTYTAEDFDFLNQFLSHFSIITTPNILTELCNLTDSINSQSDGLIYETLRQLYPLWQEIYIPSADAMDDCYTKFGLSDSVIYQIAKEDCLVLTVDLPLYGYLINKGIHAINFNHIRTGYLF
jgi:hypothetical protein